MPRTNTPPPPADAFRPSRGRRRHRVVPRIPLRSFLATLLSFLAPLTTALAAQDATPPSASASRLQGAWAEIDGTRLLRFDGPRSVMSIDGGQSVFDVTYDGETLTRRPVGLGPTLTEHVAFEDDDTLALTYPEGNTLRWTRLGEIPDALRIEPFALGSRTPDAGEVVRIQESLVERVRLDQQPRQLLQQLTNTARRAHAFESAADQATFYARADVKAVIAQMLDIDHKNVLWLWDRLHDVGWIDPERFGPEANSQAFLLVQHSMNLSLMRTVLPRLEQEAAADTRRGRQYAMLYDRAMLQLGESQRYGTQVFPLDDGVMHVLALEDAEDVDARRATLGMGPLEEYLALWRDSGAQVVVDVP